MDTSLGGARVARVLERLVAERGCPARIVLDNGPEFTGQQLDRWAYEHEVELAFIQPGKPVQNAFVESFNGTMRNECLNEHWFLNLSDARSIIENWRIDYRLNRPHSSLGGKGKKQKKYEFGTKASLVMTKESCVIVAAVAHQENIYDGHTLPEVLEMAEAVQGRRAARAIVDRGYRDRRWVEGTEVLTPNRSPPAG